MNDFLHAPRGRRSRNGTFFDGVWIDIALVKVPDGHADIKTTSINIRITPDTRD